MNLFARQLILIIGLGPSSPSYGSEVSVEFRIDSVCIAAQTKTAATLRVRGFAPAIPVAGNPPFERLNSAAPSQIIHMSHALVLENHLLRVVGRIDNATQVYFIFVPFELSQETHLIPGSLIQVERGGKLSQHRLGMCRTGTV